MKRTGWPTALCCIVAVTALVACGPAQATTGSHVRLIVPVANAQMPGCYFAMETLLFDNVSSGDASALAAIPDVLAMPVMARVARPHEQATVDVNALTSESTSRIAITVGSADLYDNARPLRVTVDAALLSAENGSAREGRTRTREMAGLALLFALKNVFRLRPAAWIETSVSNLPDQSDLEPPRLPATTQYAVVEGSPFLKALEVEYLVKHCQ